MSAAFNAAAEAIWQAVAPSLPTFSVEVLPEIDSTNTELMRRARAGLTEPTLLVALRQTAGRGRLGRTWHSDESTSLTFSLGIPLQRADWSGLSLAVGVAVVQALRGMLAVHTPQEVIADLGLKWPNDLWWHGQKLAGILIETSGQTLPRYAVIGIGVNIQATPPTPTPTPIATAPPVPPIGLQALWPGAHAALALQHIAPVLIAAIQRFEREGFAGFQSAFDAADLLRDCGVTLSDAGRANGTSDNTHDNTAFIARGVDVSGALRVETCATDGLTPAIRTVSSGEVSVRPTHQA